MKLVSREALDHRLSSSTTFGVVPCLLTTLRKIRSSLRLEHLRPALVHELTLKGAFHA
jgi:hypothetical protein